MGFPFSGRLRYQLGGTLLYASAIHSIGPYWARILGYTLTWTKIFYFDKYESDVVREGFAEIREHSAH